jgi:tetratricopeptide (TPR) repeat protein
LLALSGTTRADWQVRRGGSQALLERAERALQERPDDDAVARRLAGLAKSAQRQAILARFRARANSATSYGPKAAYARLLLATGDAAGAAEAFAQALRLSPRALPALVGRARALAVSGAMAQSLASYDQALALERQPAARRRLIEAQLALLDAGRANEAAGAGDIERQIALRRELLALDPDKDGAARRLADALERAGRLAEAAAVLEARVPPGHASSKLDLALHAARLRLQTGVESETVAVASALDALLRELPRTDAERRRDVWTLALSAARKRGTLPDVGRAIERLADRAGVAEYEVLGQVRDELGDLEGALGALRAAEDLAPRDPDLARRIISLLDRLGRDEEATQACEALTRRMPADPRLVIDLVDRQMRRGRRDDAGAALDHAVLRFARDRAALTEIAFAASRWGDQARALAAWQRLRRIDPKNEVAIIGLGEAEFQRGRKDEAKRIWAALRDGVRGSAAGHLRLAEVLLDHDLGADAAAEARRTQALEPRNVATHRLLARIFERDRKIEDAITEWNVVLELAGSKSSDDARARDEHGALRREARVRLLALYGRQGRGRLNAQIRKLSDEVKARPGDAEIALYLAEAQERAGDAAGAATTLQALLARLAGGAGSERPARDDLSVDATLALVHLLKRTGRVDEAVERLDTLARLAPARAREAHLQIADIALARYDTRRALEHTDKAAAGADGPTLARVADIESRAGADKSALASYRRAVALGAGPQAELAWAKALTRAGDEPAAVALLDRLLAASNDEDILSDAGRIAVDLGELRGRLPELQRRLTDEFGIAPRPLAHRRTLIAVLKRLLPPLYRDPAADAERLRMGRQVLRPLLDAITDAEQVPDRDAVELLGMLGNGEAAPALSRVALRPRQSATARPRSRAVEPTVTAETQLAAVIALGRLGDARGRAALERLTASADPALRAAAVLGLGRIADERGRAAVFGALSDRRPEVVSAACLALGRPGDEKAAAALSRVATDAGQAATVRVAAIVGLGRTKQRTATPTLFELLDSGEGVLSRAAAMALATSADPRATSGLLLRALTPHQYALADAAAPLAAIHAAGAGASLRDEARGLIPVPVDIESLLDMPASAGPADLSALLRLHSRELQDAIGRTLSAGGDARRAMLAALDSRSEGLGLGALTEDRGLTRPGPEVASIVRDIVQPQADRLVTLLDDSDGQIRAMALRVLAKLGDERATPARVVLAIAGADRSPQQASAAVFAAGRIARDRPDTVSAFVYALSPFLGDDSWRRRLAAVEALAMLGPPGRAALERARADRNPLVRASALAILAGHGPIDLPGAPSTMP